ncbi:MAG TPA: hypothetical protein V6C82_02435 [Chroococcales cyanobacterium]
MKDIQEKDYPEDPEDPFERAADGCSILALCNINFFRKLLRKAKSRKFLIATDVHVLSDLADPYNRDFLEAADILFMSSFLHFYSQSRDPHEALENALFFASWKVGASGGAEGFLEEGELRALRLKGQSSCDTMKTGFPPH